MRKIDKIIWHCTATPEGRADTVDDVRRWHTDPPPRGNGWSDIGYHYVIHLDGSVHEGRPLSRTGAHAKAGGNNRGSVGIAYVGGVDADMRPKDTRTPAQKAALRELTLSLLQRFPGARVLGHRDVDARKACPSFDAAADWQAFIGAREWVSTEDDERDVEAASQPGAKASTRAATAATAAAPLASMLFGADWRVVAVVAGVALALGAVALAVRPLRMRLFAALGAPA